MTLYPPHTECNNSTNEFCLELRPHVGVTHLLLGTWDLITCLYLATSHRDVSHYKIIYFWHVERGFQTSTRLHSLEWVCVVGSGLNTMFQYIMTVALGNVRRTGICRRNGFRWFPAESLAYGRNCNDHERSCETNHARVENDGLFMRLSLLHTDNQLLYISLCLLQS